MGNNGIMGDFFTREWEASLGALPRAESEDVNFILFSYFFTYSFILVNALIQTRNLDLITCFGNRCDNGKWVIAL